MHVLLVTGDRNATKYPAITARWDAALRAALAEIRRNAAPAEPCLLIHGDGLTGIDLLAGRIGLELGFLVAALPAQWTAAGRVAELPRNEQLIALGRRFLNEGASVSVYAFHDQLGFSRSTRATVEAARRAGLFVAQFRSNGAWEVMAA